MLDGKKVDWKNGDFHKFGSKKSSFGFVYFNGNFKESNVECIDFPHNFKLLTWLVAEHDVQNLIVPVAGIEERI